MQTFPFMLYLLAVLTSVTCLLLLLRGYKRTGESLLFWTGLCFVGLSVNNMLLFVDLALIPEFDLRISRHATALSGLICLLYCFIFEID